MSFFLGVDGGGTRTRVALVDRAGKEQALIDGPPTLIDPTDPEATIDVVADLCRRVASDAGVELPAAGLWAGIAGAGNEPARGAVESALREAGLSQLTAVGTDAEAAFHDAFPSGPGILLISGTGSIALARGAKGPRVRVGGWGLNLGDEGSGYGIGMAALRALVRGEDGRGVPTILRESLLQAIGLAGPADLIKWVASARKADVASLVPLICKAADEGDEAATAVLDAAVKELVQHVGAIITRLEPWPAVPQVALAGGLIQPDGPLRPRLIPALKELPCRTLDRLPDGTRGACSLAMGLADQTGVSPES